MSYNYSFESLSPVDFEVLCRDLLQRELNCHLESFAVGPDSGIDFRYIDLTNRALIVQCKHFFTSGFNSLLNALRKVEYPKIAQLQPNRYILATSISLTPSQKDKIFDTLKPFCISVSDLFGREDINNLLGEYPDIERRHFKLWLNSTEVLDALLHSKTINLTQMRLEEIKRKSKLYVRSAAFDRAKELLELENYCIITGIPGIGKSTLAEMLLMDLMRDGYDIAIISTSISEGLSFYRSDRKVAVYYDDFLGETRLQLEKNESTGLVTFINAVSRNPQSKLILTTREYILEDAIRQSEKLSLLNLDLARCVVDLSDYSEYARGQILFNHLYFSDLSEAHKKAIRADDMYREVIFHPNFNPRTVEFMTQNLKSVKGLSSVETYCRHFLSLLNNPKELWSHAFGCLTVEHKVLLWVLCMFPGQIDTRHLKHACDSALSSLTHKDYVMYDWETFRDSLKYLQGTFLALETVYTAEYDFGQSPMSTDVRELNLVRFHNPSVRDFVENFLDVNDDVLINLIDASVYFEQCQNIWIESKNRWSNQPTRRTQLIAKNSDRYLSALARTLGSECTHVDMTLFGFVIRNPSLIERCTFIVRVAKLLEQGTRYELAAITVGHINSSIRNGEYYPAQDVLELLSELEFFFNIGLLPCDPEDSEEEHIDILDAAYELFQVAELLLNVDVYSDLRDLENFAKYVELASGYIDTIDFDYAQFRFIDYINSRLRQRQLLKYELPAVEAVARALRIDIKYDIPEILPLLESDSEPGIPDRVIARSMPRPPDLIDAMFQQLSDLKNNPDYKPPDGLQTDNI